MAPESRSRNAERACSGAARFAIRPLDLAADIRLLHGWFGLPYAHYWGMQAHSEDQVRAAYRALMASGHAQAHVGTRDGAPAFLFESYDPARDLLGRHYPVQAGDLGMHFFVGPPRGPRRPGFTRDALRLLLTHLFQGPGVARIVVEPDIRNLKVHALNRAMGFVYDRALQLPHKRAALAFCSRADFRAATSLSPLQETTP